MIRQEDPPPEPSVTERADPRFARIEETSITDLARQMNTADATVPTAVASELPRITAAIEAAVARMSRGGRLIYVGAGTSGRLGVLDASECRPTFNVGPEQIFAIIAGGPQAIVDAAEGAEDDAEAGAWEMTDADVGPDDTLVGLASSGRTPFVLGAMRRARELGALTIGVSCNRDSELSALVERPIEVVVGPELVSGSTRLKAGTAQKLVLNMISTITMVKLGKTYHGLMVAVRPTNEKLRARAIRIVCSLTGADEEDAGAMLVDSGYDVATAVLRLRLGLSQDAATDRLRAANGRLDHALEESA
ncbi:N-acetylmuramic acid 6-phosphate etherase [Phytoactinopolyspora endophytica]|uniref:N-acetylmuramic acid 6-phosphate etherase n=1 Tax=Phytoactinopolyspora endophytica TaxID=1642495 RepID=UPI00101C005B|nr:N-acetylmuramic acid 6-phosphate etherase [Phytoactinopolyspora endophytica]